MEFIIIIIGIIIFLLYYHHKKITFRYLDSRGYERNGYNRLVHRDIAYRQIYEYPKYPHRFRYYDVHHIDGNKRNNHPSNLQLLLKEEHKAKHGFVLCKYCGIKRHHPRYDSCFDCKDKKFNCESCGSPVNHKGFCLDCNLKKS